MTERSVSRRCIFVAVPDRKEATLIPILKRYIARESIVYSDCFESYFGLNDYFLDHLSVNHSPGFVNPSNGVHTNTIEGTWSSLKQTIPIRKRTNNLICLYLVRYMIKKEASEPLEYILKFILSFFFDLLA